MVSILPKIPQQDKTSVSWIAVDSYFWRKAGIHPTKMKPPVGIIPPQNTSKQNSLATVCSSGNQCAVLLFVANIILSPLCAHFLVMQHSHIAHSVCKWGFMVLCVMDNEVNKEKENQNQILYYNYLGYASAQMIHRKY